MANLLGPTNPVPGHDSSVINRNIPISPNNTQIQNIPDPSRVMRPDGRHEQQTSSNLADSDRVRYDSNFQTFLQRLKESPSLAQSLSQVFFGKHGTRVTSGMSEGMAAQMAQIMQMMQMDKETLLKFLTEQFKTGSRFGGALFALLRNAYAQSSSETVRQDILQFLKAYSDFSSSSHIEGNLLRNMKGMADSMPQSWAGKLTELLAQLENGIRAGDREGNLALLKQHLFPHMSSYVNSTHDLGTARSLLGLLTLDMARYENGSQENLLQLFHRLTSYGPLKEQLGAVDDQSLLMLLKSSAASEDSMAAMFANHLSAAAAAALRGDGNLAAQQLFQQLVGAFLINESVYMPINHYIVPLEGNGRFLFSEMWVDPDDQSQNSGDSRGKGGFKVLLKVDVENVGFFDIILAGKQDELALNIFCPESVMSSSGQIEQAMNQILKQNGLKSSGISVRQMTRPVTLTEVFPQIFEQRSSVNVKV